MKKKAIAPPPKRGITGRDIEGQSTGQTDTEWWLWFQDITMKLAFTQTFNPTLDPGSVSAGGELDFTETVKGLSVNDNVHVTPPTDLATGLMVMALQCPSADTLKLRFRNDTGGAINPGNKIYLIKATRL